MKLSIGLLITIALAVFSLSASNAQVFTANSMLLKAECADFACFEAFVKPKGYVLEPTMGKSVVGGVQQSYISNSTKDYTAIFFANDTSITELFYATDNEENYRTLMADFKKEGFYLYKTLTEDDGNVDVYVTDAAVDYYVFVKVYPTVDVTAGHWKYYFKVRKYYKW